jgi:hypothetical protein
VASGGGGDVTSLPDLQGVIPGATRPVVRRLHRPHRPDPIDRPSSAIARAIVRHAGTQLSRQRLHGVALLGDCPRINPH